MPNSVDVGKKQEQAIVRHAKANGFPGADRIIRTGAGKGYAVRADEGDIWLCPGVIVQSKRLKGKTVAGTTQAKSTAEMELEVPEWLAQTEAQRVAAKAAHAVLIVRRFGFSDVGKWWAFFSFYDLCYLAGVFGMRQPQLVGVPVRLTVADAYTLLRAAGYGTPAEEGA